MSKSVNTVIDNITVSAATSSLLTSCTATDTSECLYLELEAVMTFHASATAGATVKIYGSSDGTNYTTAPIDQFTMPFTAGTTQRWSRQVMFGPKYIKVAITNLSSAQSITAVSAYTTILPV